MPWCDLGKWDPSHRMTQREEIWGSKSESEVIWLRSLLRSNQPSPKAVCAPPCFSPLGVPEQYWPASKMGPQLDVFSNPSFYLEQVLLRCGSPKFLCAFSSSATRLWISISSDKNITTTLMIIVEYQLFSSQGQTSVRGLGNRLSRWDEMGESSANFSVHIACFLLQTGS